MREFLKPSLAAIMICGAPLQAEAAEWWFVGDTVNAAVFIDRESIAPVHLYGAVYAKAWDTISRSPAAASDAQTTKSVRYYNCVDRTIGSKNHFDFRRDGSPTGERIVPDAAVKLSKVAPESVEAVLMDFVCNAERSEGDRPDFSNAGREFVFVGDIERAKEVLTPRSGTPADGVSARSRLGIAEGYKPIF